MLIKKFTITISVLFISIFLVNCQQKNNAVNNATVNQQANQQSDDQRPEIEIIFHGDNNVDEIVKKQFANALTDGLKVVWSRQEIKELYQKIKMKFILTTDIRRIINEKIFSGSTLPTVNGVVQTNSFYFSGQPEGGKVEHFIVIDQKAFHSDLSLIVALIHESVHAKNFVNKVAKENPIDEEIQAYIESIKDLEELYISSGVEAKLPKQAAELKNLIAKEKDNLNLFQNAKQSK